MKKKKISFIIISLLLLTLHVNSQYHFTPGSDTLLFDGESNVNFIKNADRCQFKVTYVEGKATGTTTRLTRFETCGVSYAYETGIFDLKDGEMVTGTIKTGDNTKIELTAPDNTIIRLGPNSETEVECNTSFEDQSQKLSLKLVLGKIWSKVTHALGGDAMQVRTSNATCGVRGTIFSFENYYENGVEVNTLRTFEGSVEFWGNPESKLDKDEITRQSKILQDDFKAGKITLDEFTKKMKVLVDPAQNTVNQYHIMVDGGNESIIRGTEPPTSPAKLVETGDEWYLDKNFGK